MTRSLDWFLRGCRARLTYMWDGGLLRALSPRAWAARRDQEARLQREIMVGPAGWWDRRQQWMLGFLMRHGMRPHHTLLEIGCGPLSGAEDFIKYLDSGHYIGLDVREESLKLAYSRVGELGLISKNPRLCLSHHFGEDCLEAWRFDFVWACAVVYHLDDDQVRECFRAVARRLNVEGRFFCNVNTVLDEGQWDEFPFTKRPVEFFARMGAAVGLLVEDLGPLADWSYPTELPGHRNHMLQVRLSGGAPTLDPPLENPRR